MVTELLSPYNTNTQYALLATVTVITLYWLVNKVLDNRTEFQSRLRNVKYVKLASQLLAILRGKRFNLIEKQNLDQHGRVFGFNLFNQYTIMVAEPELVQIVCNKEFTNFSNRRHFQNFDPIFSQLLFVTEDEQWKRIRSVVTPTFSMGKLRRMKPCIDDACMTLMKNFDNFTKENEYINVKQLVGAFTMDSIIQFGFGIKVDSLVDKNNPIITNAKKLFSTDVSLKELFITAVIFFAPKLGDWLGLRLNAEVIDYFSTLSLDIIRKKRAQYQNKESFGKANNFIELMLEAEAENILPKIEQNGNNESEKKFIKYLTNEEITAQCVLFFLVGYDTTATTISVACYELAMNPDVQEKLYENIEKDLKKLAEESENNETDPYKLVTLESLGTHFKYLEAVVNETLRKHPAAAATERRAAKDMSIETSDGQHQINVKKDDIIRIPIYSMHYDACQYPEPEKFDPERFLQAEPTFHKYSYIPFGSGPRNCVARSLALLETKIALLNIVRNYKLSRCEKTKVPVEFYIQADLNIARDVYVKAEKRN